MTVGVARALLAVNMVLTYPLEMYVARQCTMQALGVPDAQHTFAKYAPVVVGLWLATTGVAVVAGDDLGTGNSVGIVCWVRGRTLTLAQ